MKVIINVAVVATLGLCLSSGSSTAATATTTTTTERKAFKVVKEVASSRFDGIGPIVRVVARVIATIIVA